MPDNSLKKLLTCLGIAIVFAIIAYAPAPEGLSAKGQMSIALMVAAVLVWVTEVLPLAVASILFTVLPVVAHIMPLPKAMGHFATPTVFFVFAMFCISIAFENSGLNRRIVLWTSLKSGGCPTRLLFYLMMACALMSTILADIPVVAMMLPVALLLLTKNKCEPGKSSFGRAVMLGLPIACLIGGVGTPAGSAMNLLTIGLLQSTAKVQISFFDWAVIGMPMVLVLTPISWFIITRVFPPELSQLDGMDMVEQEYANLGPMTGRERLFMAVMGLNLLLWCTDKWHGIPLPVVSVLGATVFLLPCVELVSWAKDKNRIGWDILMLIGASNALGMVMWEQGAAEWLAKTCLGDISGLSLGMVIVIVSTFTVLVHLLIPVNTAIVAVLVPALVAFAGTMGINPAVLAIPMGFSVSAAFLLPLDPVPLVTYPAGYYRMFDMFKPGVFISVAWVVVMTVCMFVIAKPLGLM